MIYDQRLEGGIGAPRSMGPVRRIEELQHLKSVDGCAARHCDSPRSEIKSFHLELGRVWSTMYGRRKKVAGMRGIIEKLDVP